MPVPRLPCDRRLLPAFVATLLFACAVLVPAVANGGDNDKATAKSHYATATRLYEIREYEKALAEYKAAYVALPDPAFLFNIGQCHRKLGQNQEALNFFQQYLKKAAPDDPNRAQVEARIRDLEAEEKQKPPAAAPSQPAPATPIATTPPSATFPAQPATDTVAARPTHPPPSEEASSHGRGLRVSGIAAGAAGVASIATAVYFYTRARHYSDKVSNADIVDPADEQAGKDAETMQWVFYSAGAGLIATGAVLYWLGWSSDNPRHATVTPLLGPGLAGLCARGNF